MVSVNEGLERKRSRGNAHLLVAVWFFTVLFLERKRLGMHKDTIDPAFVATRAWTADKVLDKISTGTAEARASSRRFIWSGANLCYDGGPEFVASQYIPLSRSYTGSVRARHAPDHFFVRRNLHLDEIETWIDGLTIIPSKFPINETRAHFYMNMGNILHLVRFARKNLALSPASISVLFDNATIPADKHHVLQQQFFNLSLSEIPQSNIFSRTDIKGLTWYVICLR